MALVTFFFCQNSICDIKMYFGCKPEYVFLFIFFPFLLRVFYKLPERFTGMLFCNLLGKLKASLTALCKYSSLVAGDPMHFSGSLAGRNATEQVY